MMNAADGQGPSQSTGGGPTPLAPRTAVKIVLSVAAVVGAMGSLFYFSAVPGLEHYKYVDEVAAKVDQYRGKRLKVHGYVVEGSILKKRDTLDYKFKLETRAPRAPAVIDVEYRGLVPDNFKAGAEVVAKGTLTSDNRLMVVKDGIDAKCPSKYEGGAPKLDPSKAPPPSKPAIPPSAKL